MIKWQKFQLERWSTMGGLEISPTCLRLPVTKAAKQKTKSYDDEK